MDPAHDAPFSVVLVAIRPIAGDRQEIAVVAELIIPGRDRGHPSLEPSREPQCLGEAERIAEPITSPPVVRIVQGPDLGLQADHRLESPGGQRDGTGEHWAVGRGQHHARRRRSQPPGRRAGGRELTIRRGRIRPGPRHGLVRRPPEGHAGRRRVGTPDRTRAGGLTILPRSVADHPRRAEGPQERQGPGRLVDQDGEEVPLVPRGDRLEERRHVGHQADLIDDPSTRAGRQPPGHRRLTKRLQPRVGERRRDRRIQRGRRCSDGTARLARPLARSSAILGDPSAPVGAAPRKGRCPGATVPAARQPEPDEARQAHQPRGHDDRQESHPCFRGSSKSHRNS